MKKKKILITERYISYKSLIRFNSIVNIAVIIYDQ